MLCAFAIALCFCNFNIPDAALKVKEKAPRQLVLCKGKNEKNLTKSIKNIKKHHGITREKSQKYRNAHTSPFLDCISGRDAQAFANEKEKNDTIKAYKSNKIRKTRRNKNVQKKTALCAKAHKEITKRNLLSYSTAKTRPARNRSGGPVSTEKGVGAHPNPRPARRRGGDAQHLGVRGYAPAGVQRAAPSGAPRVGAHPAQGCAPHRRPLRRGAQAEKFLCSAFLRGMCYNGSRIKKVDFGERLYG